MRFITNYSKTGLHLISYRKLQYLESFFKWRKNMILQSKTILKKRPPPPLAQFWKLPKCDFFMFGISQLSNILIHYNQLNKQHFGLEKIWSVCRVVSIKCTRILIYLTTVHVRDVDKSVHMDLIVSHEIYTSYESN